MNFSYEPAWAACDNSGLHLLCGAVTPKSCHVLFGFSLDQSKEKQDLLQKYILHVNDRVSVSLPGGLSIVGIAKGRELNSPSRADLITVLRKSGAQLLVEVGKGLVFFDVSDSSPRSVEATVAHRELIHHRLRIPVSVACRSDRIEADVSSWFSEAVKLNETVGPVIIDSVSVISHSALVRVCDWTGNDGNKVQLMATLFCCVYTDCDDLRDAFSQSLTRLVTASDNTVQMRVYTSESGFSFISPIVCTNDTFLMGDGWKCSYDSRVHKEDVTIPSGFSRMLIIVLFALLAMVVGYMFDST